MSAFSVGFVLLLAAQWFAFWKVGDREPRAWLASIAVRLLIVVWSTLMRVPAIVPVSLAFVVVDWRNYTKWRKERLLADRIAASILADDPADGVGP